MVLGLLRSKIFLIIVCCAQTVWHNEYNKEIKIEEDYSLWGFTIIYNNNNRKKRSKFIWNALYVSE